MKELLLLLAIAGVGALLFALFDWLFIPKPAIWEVTIRDHSFQRYQLIEKLSGETWIIVDILDKDRFKVKFLSNESIRRRPR